MVSEDMVRVLPGVVRNYPVRLLDEMKPFLAVLDDIVGVCFPTPDGKADIGTMRLLSDQRGSWMGGGLFIHCWNLARERL